MRAWGFLEGMRASRVALRGTGSDCMLLSTTGARPWAPWRRWRGGGGARRQTVICRASSRLPL